MEMVLIGNGGHSKEILSVMGLNLKRFVQDSDYNQEENVYKLSEFDETRFEVMIAVGDSVLRKKILQDLPKKTKFFTYIHPTSLLFDNNIEIGEGSFIGPNCILTTNIKIGNHSLLLRNVNIGHDCLIGDYFSSMPNTVISGNVNIGECVYFGNNSSVKEKVKISNNVKIGMNGCVVKDINDSGIYIGVPVKKK